MTLIRVRRTFEHEYSIDPAHWPDYTIAELIQWEQEDPNPQDGVERWDLNQTDMKVWLDSEGS